MKPGVQLWILFWIIISILAGISAAFIVAMNSFVTSSNAESTKLALLDTMNETLYYLSDSESNVRGFIITNDDQYLTTYNWERHQIDTNLAVLRTRLKGETENLQNLEYAAQLIHQRLDRLNMAITIRMGKGLEETIKFINIGMGKILMNDIKTQFDTIKKRELDALTDHRDKIGKAASLTMGIFVVGNATSMTIIFIIFFSLRQQIHIRSIAEETVKKSEVKYRIVADNTYDWEFWTDPAGKFVYNSPACKRITGYPPEAYADNPRLFYDIVCNEHAEPFRSWFSGINTTGSPSDKEYCITRTDGEIRWLNCSCQRVYDEKGLYIGLRGSITDVTARKEDEEHIRLLSSAVETAHEYILLSDLEGAVFYANKAALGAFGLAPDDKPITRVQNLLENPSIFGIAVEKAGESGGWTGETVASNGARIPFFALLSVSVIRNTKGEITAVSCLFRDITQRKQAEDQLRALSAHLDVVWEDAMRKIARRLHDELGQDLTGLKMGLSWLSKKLSTAGNPLAEKTESLCNDVDSAIQVMRRISSEVRPVILDDLGLIPAMEWQLREFQKNTGIRYQFEYDPEGIDIDQNLSVTLFRIFQETLTNVYHHAHATEIRVTVALDTETIRMTVRDNGTGITEEEISAHSSFGILGMKERTSAYGGTFAIDGRKNKGTVISVTIPLSGERKES